METDISFKGTGNSDLGNTEIIFYRTTIFDMAS